MGPPVLVLASALWPADSVARTLADAGLSPAADLAAARAVVFSPERLDEACARVAAAPYRDRPLARIAFVPAAGPLELVGPAAMEHVGVVADAYAGDASSLAAAVDWVSRSAPAAVFSGPLRMTYLGSLGERRPPLAPALGGAVPLGARGERVTIGRSEEACAICFRQGPHSDQNTVARRHAAFERSTGGVLLTDLGSTNGTYVRGARITSTAEVSPGDEIAIAWSHRLRLEGVA